MRSNGFTRLCILFVATIISASCAVGASEDENGTKKSASEELESNLPEELVVKNNNKPNLQSIVTLISEEKLDDAVTKYKELSLSERKAILPAIVTTIYDKNVNNREKVFAFVSELPNCADDQVAYETLLQTMMDYGHHRNPEIVMLTGSVQSCDKWLKEVNKNIEKYVTYELERWAAQIRRGDYLPIKDFFDKYGKITTHPLKLITPELIKLTHANSLVNVDAILTFLRNQRWFTVDGIGYPVLYQAMVESGDGQNYEDIFKLAFRVQDVIGIIDKLKSNATLTKLSKEKLTALKEEFPKIIQTLIWNDDVECFIKNVHYEEYLYPDGDSFRNDKIERQVFAWIPKASKFPHSKWKFSVEDFGKSFKIICKFWKDRADDYVYLAVDKDENYDNLRRKIVTTKEDSPNRTVKWNLRPIKVEEGVAKGIFRLRDSDEEYYLYAGNSTHKYDQDRRRVFELVGTRAVPAASEWEIECV